VAVIAAILRAQWLSMRMGGRGRVFSVITGLVWYGIWVGVACAAYLGIVKAPADVLASYLPLGALGIFIYWQVMPILSASMGSSLDMRKLMLYPVPHSKLFQVEVLLRLTTGGEMLIVLFAAVLGLWRNPIPSSWFLLPGILLYVAFNLVLASGTRSLLERLLSKRKVREVLVFVMFMLWMIPRFAIVSGYRLKAPAVWTGLIDHAAWPWTAVAWMALGRSQAASLASLCAWLLVGWWFGRAQFERSLRFDAVAAQATPLVTRVGPWQRLAENFYRFPARLLPDPLAAMVEKELRSLVRTPRYRMVFVMGFSFGLMLWLPMILGQRASSHGAMTTHFLTVVSVYALTLLGQVSFWNCFGFDRSAALFYFAAPQPMSRVFVGKNLGALVFIYMEVFILIAVTSLFKVNFGAAQIFETMLVVGVSALYMLGLGNITSVQYPRGLNPERVSQGGASSRFQALVMILYPVSLLPVVLAYVARYAFESELAFYLVLGFAAIIGGVVYWIALESAVGTARERRERIIQSLSSGDGPVTAN
jgi:ABC-2 type transport system permease protein